MTNQEARMDISRRMAVVLQVEGEGTPIYFSSAIVTTRCLDENTVEITVSQTPPGLGDPISDDDPCREDCAAWRTGEVGK